MPSEKAENRRAFASRSCGGAGPMLLNHCRSFIRSRLSGIAGPFQLVLARWRDYDIYWHAVVIFAASRAVVYIGVRFGTLLVREPEPTKWDAGPAWYYRLSRWDAGWYADIVRNGYRYADGGQSSINFFPAYPLLSRAVKSLLHINEHLALLLVANFSALVAALLLTKLVRDESGKQVALLSLAFFCFFPSSLFLSAGYSESLCLVFILLSFIFLTRQRFPHAAAMAGLSLATRSTSIVLVPVILLEMVRYNSLPLPRFLPRFLLCAVLAVSGLLAYMVFLRLMFGHPFAFAASQDAWHSKTFVDRMLSSIALAPFAHLQWSDACWSLVFLVLAIGSFWRLRLALSLYALSVVLFPYLLDGGFDASSDRYMLMCFPAFMCLGLICKDRPWLANSLIGIFAALLLRETALFSQWYWEG